MRIKQLSASGVKSTGDFDMDLAPVTIITGDNFSGKTARLDAVRLGLAGYLPELGKRACDSFTLAANGEMSVTLTLEDGRLVSRSWQQGRTGVKSTSKGDLNVPLVLLDPNEYFGLGEKDRVRYVFKLAARELDGVADSIIQKLKAMPIEARKPQHDQAIAELVQLVDDTDRERHENDGAVPEWIEGLIAEVSSRLKASKQEAQRMTQTVQGMTVIDDEEGGNVHAVKHALESVRKGYTDLQVKLSNARSLKARAAQQRERFTKLTAMANDADGTLAKRKAELTARAADLQKLADAPAKAPPLFAALSDLGIRLATLNANLNTTVRDIQAAETKHKADMALDKCPFCGAAGDDWKEGIEAEFKTAMDKLARTHRKQLAEADKASADYNKVNAEHQAALKADAEADKARRELRQVQEQLIHAERGLADIAAAQKQLADMEVPQVDAELDAAIAAFEKSAGEMQDKIDELSVRHETQIRAQQSAVLAAKAQQRAELVRASVEVQSNALSMLEALQTEMVVQVFGNILATANKLTGDILKTKLAFKDGEIGRFDDGLWISHRTFSGMEKTLAYAAISAALAQDSPVKIILLDEMGRMTPKNKAKVVDRLAKLVEDGVIDQAICVDVDAAAYSGCKAGIMRI